MAESLVQPQMTQNPSGIPMLPEARMCAVGQLMRDVWKE
jgi:hypothetical protein